MNYPEHINDVPGVEWNLEEHLLWKHKGVTVQTGKRSADDIHPVLLQTPRWLLQRHPVPLHKKGNKRHLDDTRGKQLVKSDHPKKGFAEKQQRIPLRTKGRKGLPEWWNEAVWRVHTTQNQTALQTVTVHITSTGRDPTREPIARLKINHFPK